VDYVRHRPITGRDAVGHQSKYSEFIEQISPVSSHCLLGPFDDIGIPTAKVDLVHFLVFAIPDSVIKLAEIIATAVLAIVFDRDFEDGATNHTRPFDRLHGYCTRLVPTVSDTPEDLGIVGRFSLCVRHTGVAHCVVSSLSCEVVVGSGSVVGSDGAINNQSACVIHDTEIEPPDSYQTNAQSQTDPTQ
jgi:hypothetical protein